MPAGAKRKRKPSVRRTAPATSTAVAVAQEPAQEPAQETLDPKNEVFLPEEVTGPLLPRHRAFVAAYAKCWNGTKAYKEIYGENISDDVAASAGSRLLGNVKIKREIYELTRRVADEAEINVSFVLKGAKEVFDRSLQRVPVMYFDKDAKTMKQETVMVEDPETGEVGEEGVWKFDPNGAMRALELLAKHTGGFTAKEEGTSPSGGTVTNHVYYFAGQKIVLASVAG